MIVKSLQPSYESLFSGETNHSLHNSSEAECGHKVVCGLLGTNFDDTSPQVINIVKMVANTEIGLQSYSGYC